MYGNSGNNSFSPGSGVATMYGGAGDDLYYVNNAADQVIEYSGEGFDTIFSTVSYVLPTNVDVLCLTGTADLSITGNDIFNFLYGNAGNNTITAGNGMAYLLGCDGNDSYYLSNAAIGVVEALAGGFDSLYIAASYTLSDYCEALYLTGSGDFSLAGNDLTHFLYGNSGNNSLTAGTGVATMAGGAGDDLYYVNKAADQVVENPGEGFDTVFSTVSYTLPANVDALCLIGSGNTTAMGNSGVNFIYGNSGNNVLDGGGGNDALYGGTGADRFVFTVGGGNDTVSDFSHAQGDLLDVTAFNTSFGALSIAASGSDTLVTIVGQTITLSGISPGSLISSDFLF